MPKTSAGIVLYRFHAAAAASFELQVLLVYPGGPIWKKRGAWFIPKGELKEGEEPVDGALREFEEETGFPLPSGPLLALGELRKASGKRMLAFAAQGEVDPAQLRSNQFEMEWPPRSGRRQSFPEVERAAYFTLAEARQRLHASELPFLDCLEAALGDKPSPA